MTDMRLERRYARLILGAIGPILALSVAVSGCAGRAPAPTAPSADISVASTTPEASRTPESTKASLADTVENTVQSSDITISGTIIEGLRPNCRVLQTDQRRYALTGSPSDQLAVGQQVTVTGQPRPDLKNPCGSAFVVSSIG